MGTIIGKSNKIGDPVKVNDARDHIFGYVLLNDWSARDMQVWEYTPLGPFNAKNFASSISPWIITPEALAPFKIALPAQEPKLLPYL
jgi:fumarylacetoacetase